jgi:tRNA-dihydrouridine synthase A
VDTFFPHPFRTGGRLSDPKVLSTEYWEAVRDAMMAHAGGVIARGGRVAHVTRHMIGLFQGFPGARKYRQILSTDATKPGAGPEVIAAAFAAVLSARAETAAAE